MPSKFNHNASPEIFRRAKELRESMTIAEQVLWERLRAGRLNGLNFRRQHPTSKYIVDFYCHQYKLVIELDGEVHLEKDQKERDFSREEELKNLGLHIIRFTNESVLHETNEVLFKILDKISELKKLNTNL
ncbi:Very-short-patch-repair endonuclease [Belliella buryatensis]|uniref:Very-short-patch-repair endonuclease n=1 Tax=Belliella buryatensis TaxID=1500549 RepID=A0A239CUW5_9BACT|nr:endonuclease domain-containing protein [Belliella buryatensis]SNS23588.1 Very-short-patch-repair endonuclease [Belliella buryatensis]